MTSDEDVSQCFKGTYEVQECLEGQCEADLHKHKKNCKKNPDHVGFIPIKELTIDHLPPGYRDKDTFDFAHAMAHLTVRIAVNFTSPDRPEFVPGTQDPYPCYNTREKNVLRTGTGWVWDVILYTEKMLRYKPCPCHECDQSDTRSKVWWEVVVRTAKHVVFDSSEARKSTCRLWFDDDNSPLVNIYGWKVGWSDLEGDWCKWHCVTHNFEVVDKLKEMVRQFYNLRRKVMKSHDTRNDEDKMTIIVSHPHGCSKQVSVGHWVHRQVVEDNDTDTWTRYTYTSNTCPGSSGAQVYRLGCWVSNHPHSGVNSGGLNYSAVWMDLNLKLSAIV